MPYFIQLVQRLKIVDSPDKRRINTVPIPRMGGLLIYLIVVVSLLSYTTHFKSVVSILIPSFLIFACGIIDDLMDIKWSIKFLLQFVAAILLVFFLKPLFGVLFLFGIAVPSPLDVIILTVFIVGVINSVNLLDGLDGLASGFSLIIFSTIFALAFLNSNSLLLILAAAMCGSLIGFLKSNAFPASIFLGDTGSLSLGFFTVAAALLTSIDLKPQILDLTFPIILLALPIVDTLKVMILRILDKKNPFLPDKTHLHHIIYGNNVKHKITVFIIHSFGILFSFTALVYYKVSEFYAISIFLVLVAILLFIKQIIARLNKISTIRLAYHKLIEFPSGIIGFYKKNFVFVSSFIIAFLIISLLPVKPFFDHSSILFLLGISVMLLCMAILAIKKKRGINDIYVLFNLMIFIIYSNFTRTFMEELSKNSYMYMNLEKAFLVFLIIGVVFFIIFKDRFIQDGRSFVSGIDLTMLVFIAVSIIAHNLLELEKLKFAGFDLLLAYLIYIWYKITIIFNRRFTKYIFYASFFLPIFALLLSL
jgi:UDP-GlcNAc:undecaprenyl-phosphate GlcNAc-1-phosphate transferase